MKKIIITIDDEGGSTIETQGFKGKECLEATAVLERELGAKVSDTPTAEMHRPQQGVINSDARISNQS